MYISRNSPRWIELNITIEECRAMLNKDEVPLSEFCELIQKYVQWIDDIKTINTKRILGIK